MFIGLPNVQIPQASYSVNYDQFATIPCTVIATPGITSVQWIKLVNGVEQNIDMTQAKYSGAATNNPALTIANANLNDEAVYICTATNSVGTGRSRQTYLDVVGGNFVISYIVTYCMNDVQIYSIVNEVNVGFFLFIRLIQIFLIFIRFNYNKCKCNKKFIIFTKHGPLTGRCRCDIHNVRFLSIR